MSESGWDDRTYDEYMKLFGQPIQSTLMSYQSVSSMLAGVLGTMSNFLSSVEDMLFESDQISRRADKEFGDIEKDLWGGRQ